MPLYSHFCPDCQQITEHVCKIADRKQFVLCDHCGGSAERVICAAIQRVEPTWLEEAKLGLHSQDRHQVYDRNSLDRYCKANGVDQIG